MVAHKGYAQPGMVRRRAPRRLRFERLEVRDLLAVLGLPAADAAGSDADGSDAAAAVVQIRLQATDLCGQPIERVSVGSSFWLEAYVEDLRVYPKGVFAAYLDVVYDAGLVSTPVNNKYDVIFGTPYQNGKAGDFAAGLMDEVGAFAGFTQLLGGEHLLFAVPFLAESPGLVDFAGTTADVFGHEVLVYGDDSPVALEDVRIVGTQLAVQGSPLAAEGQDLGLTCSGTIVAGSGAYLASTGPAVAPDDLYKWTEDAYSNSATPSWEVTADDSSGRPDGEVGVADSRWTWDWDVVADDAPWIPGWQAAFDRSGDDSWLAFDWEPAGSDIETDRIPVMTIEWSEPIVVGESWAEIAVGRLNGDWDGGVFNDLVWLRGEVGADAYDGSGRAFSTASVDVDLSSGGSFQAIPVVDALGPTGVSAKVLSSDPDRQFAAGRHRPLFVTFGSTGGAETPVPVTDDRMVPGRPPMSSPDRQIARPTDATARSQSRDRNDISASEWVWDGFPDAFPESLLR